MPANYNLPISTFLFNQQFPCSTVSLRERTSQKAARGVKFRRSLCIVWMMDYCEGVVVACGVCVCGHILVYYEKSTSCFIRIRYDMEEEERDKSLSHVSVPYGKVSFLSLLFLFCKNGCWTCFLGFLRLLFGVCVVVTYVCTIHKRVTPPFVAPLFVNTILSVGGHFDCEVKSIIRRDIAMYCSLD